MKTPNKAQKKIVKTAQKRMSLNASRPKKDSGYDKDFSKWVENQATYLGKQEFAKLDIENLIEEIESLGRSERRTLGSYLEVLLMHMLKLKYQPEKRTNSWNLSIKNSRYKVKNVLRDNPSLKPKLPAILKNSYKSARLDAALETQLPEKTFPVNCPWTIEDILS